MDEQPLSDVPGAPVISPAQGPLAYVTAAIAIVKLDTEAIVRVSRDPMALVYGAVAYAVVTALGLFLGRVIAGTGPSGFGIAIATVFGLVVSALTTGIVHLLAKVMFQASGSLVGLLRVLWLGSIVSLLGVIPILGGIVGAIWSLLIMMVTFQEVDGIERLQALGLSLVVSLGFFAVLGAITRAFIAAG